MTTTREARETAIEIIKDAANDGYLLGNDTAEIHHQVFNTDYFIIGRYEASKWLESDAGGAFNAIGVIKEYETDNFGEVITDLSEPEHVANMYIYIAGNEVLNSLDTIQDNWGENLTEEMQQQLLEELEQA